MTHAGKDDNRLLKDVMTCNVKTVAPPTAYKRRRRNESLNVGAIPVCDGVRLRGRLMADREDYGAWCSELVKRPCLTAFPDGCTLVQLRHHSLNCSAPTCERRGDNYGSYRVRRTTLVG